MYEGISKGVANVQAYVQDAERREAQNAQYRLATQKANQQLLKEQTYGAFNRYEADGDARHLNMFLNDAKQNPAGAKVYGDTVRMDNLYKSSEVDQLLRQAGYQNPDEVYNDPNNGLLLATTASEGLKLVPKQNLYAATGYTNYMSDQQLAKMEKQARINQQLLAGGSREVIDIKESVVDYLMSAEGLSRIEAEGRVKTLSPETKVGTSANERMIAALREDNPELSYQDALSIVQGEGYQSNEQRYVDAKRAEGDPRPESELIAEYKNIVRTGTQKELNTIDAVKANLDEQNFFDMDIGAMKPAERAKVHSNIAKIEDLRGIKLGTEDKRLARDIRNLTALGAKAGEQLTEEETGLIDSTLNSLKAYMFDETTGGTQGKAAYESFRNIFRNALYGATLTESEIKAFNAAMGTLGQQTGPVLQKLNEQMRSLRNQLQSIANYNDPYLAHYYFVTDLDDLDEKIRRIDERAALISGYSGPGLSTSQDIKFTIKTTEPQVDSTGAPDLDAIWAKSMGGQ